MSENTQSTFHTGLDIVCDTVTSICSGVVLYCGYTPEKQHTVIVQYDDSQVIRYCHMKSVDVSKGSIVRRKDSQNVTDTEFQTIGKADKYVHVDYLTRTKSEGLPVRLMDQIWWPQPTDKLKDSSFPDPIILQTFDMEAI